jgi:hypothetical protein
LLLLTHDAHDEPSAKEDVETAWQEQASKLGTKGDHFETHDETGKAHEGTPAKSRTDRENCTSNDSSEQ